LKAAVCFVRRFYDIVKKMKICLVLSARSESGSPRGSGQGLTALSTGKSCNWSFYRRFASEPFRPSSR